MDYIKQTSKSFPICTYSYSPFFRFPYLQTCVKFCPSANNIRVLTSPSSGLQCFCWFLTDILLHTDSVAPVPADTCDITSNRGIHADISQLILDIPQFIMTSMMLYFAICTKITEVNLSAFVYILFHEACLFTHCNNIYL